MGAAFIAALIATGGSDIGGEGDPSKANADYIRAWADLILSAAGPPASPEAARHAKAIRGIPRSRTLLGPALGDRAHPV